MLKGKHKVTYKTNIKYNVEANMKRLVVIEIIIDKKVKA